MPIHTDPARATTTWALGLSTCGATPALLAHTATGRQVESAVLAAQAPRVRLACKGMGWEGLMFHPSPAPAPFVWLHPPI